MRCMGVRDNMVHLIIAYTLNDQCIVVLITQTSP
uniref:Uncharacterized protein n=1 Tax=viral metagenome TaxID=1070528 RepID=A0A6C0BPJ6_9ZZZZ